MVNLAKGQVEVKRMPCPGTKLSCQMKMENTLWTATEVGFWDGGGNKAEKKTFSSPHAPHLPPLSEFIFPLCRNVALETLLRDIYVKECFGFLSGPKHAPRHDGGFEQTGLFLAQTAQCVPSRAV